MPLATRIDVSPLLLDPPVKQLFNDLHTAANGAVNGVTAAVGSSQATGVAVTAAITRVTTVGTAGDALTLPKAAPGLQLVVINAAAANSMDVFPAVGDAINALSADAALAVAANKTVLLVCAVAGFWNAIVTA